MSQPGSIAPRQVPSPARSTPVASASPTWPTVRGGAPGAGVTVGTGRTGADGRDWGGGDGRDGRGGHPRHVALLRELRHGARRPAVPVVRCRQPRRLAV